MASTTTITAVRDAIASTVDALTPATHSDKLYRRSPRRYPLRVWAGEQTKSSAAFRKYEIVRTGPAIDAPLMDPSAVERVEILTMTVAYPTLPGLYATGTEERDEMDEVIRQDARQLRDTIFKSSNYLAGQSAAFVTIQAPDLGDPLMTYQDLTIEVRYLEAQSL